MESKPNFRTEATYLDDSVDREFFEVRTEAEARAEEMFSEFRKLKMVRVFEKDPDPEIRRYVCIFMRANPPWRDQDAALQDRTPLPTLQFQGSLLQEKEESRAMG